MVNPDNMDVLCSGAYIACRLIFFDASLVTYHASSDTQQRSFILSVRQFDRPVDPPLCSRSLSVSSSESPYAPSSEAASARLVVTAPALESPPAAATATAAVAEVPGQCCRFAWVSGTGCSVGFVFLPVLLSGRTSFLFPVVAIAGWGAARGALTKFEDWSCFFFHSPSQVPLQGRP
jgi:hypothetical protein